MLLLFLAHEKRKSIASKLAPTKESGGACHAGIPTPGRGGIPVPAANPRRHAACKAMAR
jgi:hypothetical protein